MAEETARKDHGLRKRFTKGQAVGVMVTGGLLLVVPWFIPSEHGSTLQVVKTAISLAGFVGLCVGSYYRP